ncbi:helicase-related protein [Pelotomaculum propionicicum]|uniref:RNA polymerase-associated protein RapA n=1 Tax=Pelotomaculum propionicicum TaxID=258475 RepID=A0A4Y7RJC7_9FIRM|nr:helicase-related protein [Pelotomaculum propionicicum]TEB09085.1 RNA polymerase-associated protein RapA [Pelotomaculum propionicicum]
MEISGASPEDRGLRSRRWLLSYKTSSTIIDGCPVDILKDFYIPALQLSVRYDRVAGYFRSSSLAAASQGFSSFAGRQGKMRLIVGADLEPDDVKAILAGDRERLAAKLNSELERPESWPENVQNGVTLLAWMVARGYLEVRVAFRVHGETGDPLPIDAVDDGYVHEKWFVLHDEFGNRLYGAGTLNESKTALVLNAENIDVHCDWWGDTDRWRVDEAVESFEYLWAGRVSHMPVMSLPEAVQRRLVRFAEGVDRPVEIDGTISVPGAVQPPSALERLRFAVLRDAPKMPGGRFVGMETAPVEPWPHQAVVVRRLVETWPYSYLLCDEVGLGKTIEAGLAFRSLYLSGLVRRILIAAPASLTKQWHRQMASKMLLSFGRVRTMPETCHEYIFPLEENRPAASLYDPDLVIVSTGLLSRRERLPALMQATGFDIALVDEAHAARRRKPGSGISANPEYGHLYTAIRDHLRERTKSLWLATATPMQIDPVEVYDLLALTNRVGAFQFDPMLTQQYYEVLGKLVFGQDPDEHEWSFLRRAVKAVRGQDPMLWRFIEESVIDGRIRSAVKQWLENGRIPSGRDRELMLRLIFSISPLSRVMLRHNRRLLEIYRDNGQLQQNLASRHIQRMPTIKFTPLEQHIYDQLEDYCQGLARQIRARGDSQARQMISFLLSFLRLRFASSLYAFRETLQNRLRKVEATLRHQSFMEVDESEPGASSLEDLVYDGEDEDDLPAVESLLKNRTPEDLKWERDRLKDMISDMADLTGPSSKMQELFQTLERRKYRQTGRIRQTVIFTRFYDTLTDIVNRLRQADPRMLIGTYSGRGAEYYDQGTGRMVNVDREEVKERFLREEIDVLVCTDAAAEGLNLQTADLLVNFDLGWNPMKIEQRIGRIDRIGQKHQDIFVQNLCYLGSAEEIVYGRLLDRLAEASLIVGTQQVSLLPVTPEEFQKLAEGVLTQEELMASALKRIEIRRKQTESMEISPKDLYDIYMRMARASVPAPVNLAAIWEAISGSKYLKDLGCVVSKEPAKPTFTLYGFENITNGTVLTVSRDLYEEGMADGGSRVHFASYGDPFFDAILEHFSGFDLPSCIHRISVLVHGMNDVEMVGYAVACHGPGGSREVRLVRSWPDLDGLQLAEAESLSEAEIGPLREQLERIARDELEPCLVANRIERGNIRAAHAHEMLNYLVARGLLELRARFAGDGALYLPVLREVESLYQDRDRVNLPDLPADVLKPIKGDLLFECHVPGVGDKAQLYVPYILAQTALNAANRLVDSMKVRKSELRVDTVLARLQREIEAKRRQVG